MALVGINAVNRQEKRTKTEKILDNILKVAQLTNFGVDIVTGLKDRKLGRELNERKQTLDEVTNLQPGQQGEESSFVLPGKSAFGQDAIVKKRTDLSDIIKAGQITKSQKESGPVNKTTAGIYKSLFPKMPVPETQGEAQDMINFGIQKSFQEPGAVTEREKFEKPGQDQRISAGFGVIMDRADKVIEDKTNILTKPTSRINYLLNKIKAGEALTPEEQLAYNAKEQFVSAVLRKQSGAAISPQEFEAEDKKYFPQSGETNEVIFQKSMFRKMVIASFKAAAGEKAWNDVMNEFSKQEVQVPLQKSNKVLIGGVEFNP